jgi:hypothetical protein
MKFAVLAMACLAACSSLVPSTVAQLQATSPAEVDPAAIEVAILMPAGLQPQPQKAVLTLTGSRTDTGETARLDVVLAERAVTLEGVDVQPGESVFAYRLADADLAAVRAQQAVLDAWEAAAPDATQGSLSVGLGACTVGEGPTPDAAGAVYIRMAPGAPMMPLIRRAPIVALVGAAAIAGIGPCPPPQ